jgi:hypothetical protein
VSGDVFVSLRRPERESAAASPNLELRLPPGGAAALAGVLADHPVMAAERPGDAVPPEPLWRIGGDMSPADLAAEPVVAVPPGPTRIRLELPWGSWSHVVTVPETGGAAVSLPAAVGRPPLRVRLHQESNRDRRRILGTDAAPGPVTGRVSFAGPTPATVALARRIRSSTAPWALSAPRPPTPSDDWGIVALDGPQPARFPLWRNRDFAVERIDGALRVEPLSGVETPEWDLLLSAGRLEALTLQDTRTLARRKWQDELLGLASAYAYSAVGEWPALEVVLRNLGYLMQRPGEPPVDLTIIAADADARAGGAFRSPIADPIAGLEHAAARGSVPLLHWGVRLALALIGDPTAPSPAMIRWSEQLHGIDRTLALGSVWTAWSGD